jgi:hypothetical protein
MTLQQHYQNLPTNDAERDTLCLLLDRSPTQFNLGLDSFSKNISSHVGKFDMKRLLAGLIPLLITADAFLLPNGDYLTPKEALEMLDSVLYLQILFEELHLKSGRRSFFIANFKSVNPGMVFMALEFILYKTQGKSPKDLLALSIGLKSYNLGFVSAINTADRIKSFKDLTRKNKIVIFENESFVGLTNYKNICDVEDLLQIIFDEITRLVRYFDKQDGVYFELYGNLAGITSLPVAVLITPPSTQSIAKVKVVSPIEKSLMLLKLKELPVSKKDLKKIFFRLAVATHPDKFEHVDKGTRTEIAILDKFREIHNAYEIIEKELDRLNRN